MVQLQKASQNAECRVCTGSSDAVWKQAACLLWCSQRHVRRSRQSATRLWKCLPCQSQSSAASRLPALPTALLGRTQHTWTSTTQVKNMIDTWTLFAKISRHALLQTGDNSSSSSSMSLQHSVSYPPAGPDRTALWPQKEDTGDRPPSDCMKDSCTSFNPSSNPD